MTAASGTVQLDGKDSTTLSHRDVALQIAFVPQSEPTVFEFSVKEIVLMGRHPHLHGLSGERKDDFEAAARAMAAMDILELADRPVTSLSGGEHRRVLIARALAQQAPCLLLDEPTAHLDITHQVEILALARRMADNEGTAVLAALHDLNLAADYCDRLILIAGGRVIAQGSPEEVLTTELLERAYGSPLEVRQNPVSGRPMVFPIAVDSNVIANRARVHVICGGATGGSLLSGLLRLGFSVTTGVLNQLDSDQRAAEALGIEHVTESPFSPIGSSAHKACTALIAKAELVVITELPVGHGNLANLEMAREAQAAGKKILLIESGPFSARDFTDGEVAQGYWDALRENGAILATDSSAALAQIVALTNDSRTNNGD